jgi:hypothetical protein
MKIEADGLRRGVALIVEKIDGDELNLRPND